MFKNITFLLLFQSLLFSNDVDVYHFHFHGNFCGAQFPLITHKTKQEELQILNNLNKLLNFFSLMIPKRVSELKLI
jgi:hypothetical protein